MKSEPAYVEAQVQWAEALRSSERFEESLPHYEQAMRLDPRVAEAKLGYAMALAGLKRYDAARVQLTEGRTLYPNRPEFAETLARLPGATRGVQMTSLNTSRIRSHVIVAVVAVAVAAAAAGGYLWSQRRGLPAPDSPAYEQTVRSFYRGLAALQVGLLDDAKREFTRTTELAPREPAGWANLGVTHLRLGDFDPALQAIQRAESLAPSSSDVVLLLGQLESTRGRLDQAIADFRRAVDLGPGNLRARFALAQEIERAAGPLESTGSRGPNADAEAQQLLEDLLSRRPENLAVLVERTRLAVKRADARALQDSVTRLAKYVNEWPPVAVEQFRELQRAAEAADYAAAAPAIARLRNVLVREPSFREGLAEVKPAAELIGEPFVRFVRLPPPSSEPSPPDTRLTFVAQGLSPALPENAASRAGVAQDFSPAPQVTAFS